MDLILEKENAEVIFHIVCLVFSNILYYFCSILSADFIRTSIHDAAERDLTILSKAKARASLPMNGVDDEVRL